MSLLSYNLFQMRQMTQQEILEAICELADSDFSKVSIDEHEKIFCNLYNQLQKMDINPIFRDHFVCMIRKIIKYFLNKDISREITLFIFLIFTKISTENCDKLLENVPDIISFIIHFMKWKKGGLIYIRKYYLIAMQISVVCPILIPTFLEHMDILHIKKLIGNDGNDNDTIFMIYNWIYHISSQPCGIDFILKESDYFTKILCELVKNTTLQIFFQKAIMTLENIMRLNISSIRVMILSELTGCIPNMMKVYFPQDLKEKWECVQKMF